MKNFLSKILVGIFLIFVVPASPQADNRTKVEILTKLSTECGNTVHSSNSPNKHDDSRVTNSHPLSLISVAVVSRGNVAKYFSHELSFLLLTNDLLYNGAHFTTDFKRGTSYFLIQCQSVFPVSLVTTFKNSQVNPTNSARHFGISNPCGNSDGVQFQNILTDSLLVSVNMSTLPRTLNFTCAELPVTGSTRQYESRIGFSIFHNKLVGQAQLDFKAEYTDENIFVETMSKGGVLRVCLPLHPLGTENVVGWLNESIPLDDVIGDHVPSGNSLLRHIFIIGALILAVVFGSGFGKILQSSPELDDSV